MVTYSQNSEKNTSYLLSSYLANCNRMKNTSADSLFKYANLAHDIAYKINDADDQSLSDYYCAYCMMIQGKIDSAGMATDKAFGKLKDSIRESNTYELLAQLKVNVLIRQQKYKGAVEESLKYLSISEILKDTLFEIVFKNYVGLAHMKMLQKEEALKWYLDALSTSSDTNLFHRFPIIYGNIGIIYVTLSKWDSAEYYAKLAIRYEKDSQNLSGLSGVLPAIGAVYMETNRTNVAEEPFDESLADARKLNDPFMIIASLISNATYYHATGNYKKSLAMCVEAIGLIQQYHIPSQLSYTYRTFADDYKQLDDYKNYSKALEEELTIEDSLYKKNSAESIADLQEKYELQKKGNTILKQQFELGRKSFWIYGGFVLSATIFVFSFFLFRANRNRQKINLQLMKKKQQFQEEQAVKDAEEKERKRVAAELHDDMGTRINILSHAASQLMDISPELGLRIKENSDDLMQSLRETVWTLKQEVILSSDVWIRFKNFISKLRNSYSSILFEIIEDECLEKKLNYNEALHLIRILQEAAGNAIKHSLCTQITCEKKSKGDSILFRVADNGSGIFAFGENDSDGNGIPNMQRRAKDCNFHFEINSLPGKGTAVEVVV